MSVTDNMDHRLINEVIKTENGIAKASVLINSLKIVAQKDGGCYLTAESNHQAIAFFLKPDECRHLAELLASCA